MSVDTPAFERRAQFSGATKKLQDDLPKGAAGLLGFTAHEVVQKMSGNETSLTDWVSSRDRVGIVSLYMLDAVARPADLEGGRFLPAHRPKKEEHQTARYRQFVKKVMSLFVRQSVRFYGFERGCQVMQCLANNKPFDPHRASVKLCEPCERKLLPNTGKFTREDVHDRYMALSKTLKKTEVQLGHARVAYKYYNEFAAEILWLEKAAANLRSLWADSVCVHLNEEVIAVFPDNGQTYRATVVSLDEKDRTSPLVGTNISATYS